MKKHWVTIPVCVLLATLSGCATNAPVGQSHAAAAVVASVEGTVWRGVDSDGDTYDYAFDAGGQLRYKKPDSDGWLRNGTWKQNKSELYMETNNKYAEHVAEIKGSHMEGRGWNIKGLKWTWVADKH